MILSATEFKAKCLAILERIRATGEKVTVTKHGIPIADVVPAGAGGRSPQDELQGTVKVLGDILGPALPAGAWEVESSRGEAPAHVAGGARDSRRGPRRRQRR